MAIKKLSERFAAPMTGCRVDRDAKTIRGLLICGFESANKRSYRWGHGLTFDPAAYIGRYGYCNHSKNGRLVEDKMFKITAAYPGDDGQPLGDIRYFESHPMSLRLIEAAENPELNDAFGLSHVAVCATRIENGVEVIESIQSVESVDLVADPATTRGLYESKRTMKRKLTTFLESIAPKRPAAGKWAKSKKLQEMDDGYADGMPDMPDAEVIGDEVDDVSAGITDAFRTALYAMMDDLLASSGDPTAVKAIAAKVKKMAAAHGDINGDGKVDAADIDAVDEVEVEDAMPAMESKGAKHVLAVIESLTTAKIPVTVKTIKAVGYIPAGERADSLRTLTEAVGVKPGETPRTTGRTPTNKMLAEANAADPMDITKATFG